MECNKDEALKAREVAEKKFEEKDLIGARKFAMKAQSLFPGLEGLQSLLATLNVYLSAERKVNGEVDWYGVLGIEPSSDDETVRKQYRKLALTLHPDKNKSIGAEGAFKILSEAWSLLSDKANRKAYDQKRTARKMYEKVIPTKPSNPVGSNSVHRSVNNSTFSMRSHNAPNPNIKSVPPPKQNAPNPNIKSVPPPKRVTFWTMCTSCKMQFEYDLVYLNKKLECYTCKEPFLAIQIPPPQTNPPSPWAAQSPQNFSTGYSGNAGSMPAAASSATLEAAMKSKTSALKRPHAGEANGSCFTGKGEKTKRRRRASEPKVNGHGTGESDHHIIKGTTANNIGISNGFKSGITETERVAISGTGLPAISRELSLLETRNMLMAKARTEICKKLNEWKSADLKGKASDKETGPRDKAKTREKSGSKTQLKADANGMKNAGRKRDGNAGLKHSDENLETSSLFSSESNFEVSEKVPSSMIVPDPDFHDFDKDRTEKAFGDNQVWAAYDNDDGMPRFYAMIHSVISRKPFKMRISWLNSKNTTEFGSINWVGCGFYKTSGNFRVGKHEINKSVNSFSHRVKWTKGTRGAIQIYPGKGDVWALFRNWSPEWNEHTPDDVIHQYEMVEVLEDYNEEKGATIIPLVKITGFKTVFHQHKDQEQVKVIPREEMFRFSHQVPAFLLTGEESANAPKGCWELDPAATSLELVKMMARSADEVKKESGGKVAIDGLSDRKGAIRSNIGVNEAGKMGDVSVKVGTIVG